MPGPVSDSYDPEFGTGENARRVCDAIRQQVARITSRLGPKLSDIVSVVNGPAGQRFNGLRFTERDLRIIRFALNRAMESL
jgi:hypothetical protein